VPERLDDADADADASARAAASAWADVLGEAGLCREQNLAAGRAERQGREGKGREGKGREGQGRAGQGREVGVREHGDAAPNERVGAVPGLTERA
jgi:hypothetical protein